MIHDPSSEGGHLPSEATPVFSSERLKEVAGLFVKLGCIAFVDQLRTLL